MQRRLAIAGKGQHVGHQTVLLHFQQLAAQTALHLVGSGKRVLRATLTIESALTIDAVETAHLAALGQQIDAERHTEPATVHRPEHGGIVDNCTHNDYKGTTN